MCIHNSTTENNFVRWYDDAVRVGILWIYRDWDTEDRCPWYSSTLVDSSRWHLSVTCAGERCWEIKVLVKEGGEYRPLDQYLDPTFGHDALKEEVGFEGEFCHGKLLFEDVEEFYRVSTELFGRFGCTHP